MKTAPFGLNFDSHLGNTCSGGSPSPIPSPQKTQIRPLRSESVDDTDGQPTQQTQPKGVDPTTGKPYEPIEIPVPTRDTFDRLLGRAESTPPPKD